MMNAHTHVRLHSDKFNWTVTVGEGGGKYRGASTVDLVALNLMAVIRQLIRCGGYGHRRRHTAKTAEDWTSPLRT